MTTQRNGKAIFRSLRWHLRGLDASRWDGGVDWLIYTPEEIEQCIDPHWKVTILREGQVIYESNSDLSSNYQPVREISTKDNS